MLNTSGHDMRVNQATLHLLGYTETELMGQPVSVVVLTTSNEERDKVAAYNLNVAGYILNPMGPERLIEEIGTLNLYWNLIEPP